MKPEVKVKVGSKARITKNIYDSSPDQCYPPGYIAWTGDTVVVRSIHGERIAVAHEHVHDNAFYIGSSEYELILGEAK